MTFKNFEIAILQNLLYHTKDSIVRRRYESIPFLLNHKTSNASFVIGCVSRDFFPQVFYLRYGYGNAVGSIVAELLSFATISFF